MFEERDWHEYLAWTRGAAAWQYAETEERAWARLQAAALRRSLGRSFYAPLSVASEGGGGELQPLQPEAEQQPPADDQRPDDQQHSQQHDDQQHDDQQPDQGDPGSPGGAQ